MNFIKIIILSIILLYLQVLFIPQISVFGNYFNILLPLIVLIATKSNFNFSLILTFFIALSFDLIYPYTLGLNGIIFLIINFVLLTYRNYFNFNNFLILLLIMFAVNILYYFTIFIYFLFSGDKNPALSISFVIMITLNTLLNTLLYFIYLFLIKLNISLSDG